MNRPKLIELFNTKNTQNTFDIAINYEVIDKNAYSLTNGFKHKLSNSSDTAYREVLPEVGKFILTYVDSDAQLLLQEQEEYVFSLASSPLFKETNDFNENGRWSFVLVADALSELTEEQKKAIVSINWSLILDFDTFSEINGLADAFVKDRKLQPLKFNQMRPQNTKFNKFTTTPYWFFLNGISDSQATLVDETDFRKWGQKYGSKLNQAFENYHSVFDKPIKVVILSSSIKKVKKIIEALDQVYEDNVQFLILSSPASYIDIDEQCEIKKIPLSSTDFANCILANLSLFKNNKKTYSYMMPAKMEFWYQLNLIIIVIFKLSIKI